jgi:hypothetical protein
MFYKIAKKYQFLSDISIRGFWLSRWMDENAATDKVSKMYDHLTALAISGQLSPPKHKVTIFPKAIITATFTKARRFCNRKRTFINF